MKSKKTWRYFVVLILLLATPGWIHAQGTAFTYQGQLYDGANPANGSYDLRLLLFNALAGGSQVGITQTNIGVGVTNGLFTLTVDFGPEFTGASNWLGIEVRTNGGSSFIPLSPRQQLTPTPYAIFAEGANAAGLAGTVPSGGLSGTYSGAITLNNAANKINGNGGGLTNLNASQLTTGTVNDALLSGNVALLNANQTFSGVNKFTGSNQSIIINANGPVGTNLFTGLGLYYDNNTGEGTVMSSFNDDHSSLTFYTKPGPGFPAAKQVKIDRYGSLMIDQQNANYGALDDGTTNGVSLVFGTSGGEGIASQRTPGVNKNGLDFYTGNNRQMSILNNGNVGMGTTNPSTALQVSGTVTATAFAGDGAGLTNLNANNLANGTVPNGVLSGFQGNFSTVGGGNGNTAGNNEATVSGGFNNTATGQFATVPGGNSNLASGKYSFAAGRQAQATNQGAFVWADSQNAPFNSTNQDSFNVRAQGGVNFVTSGAGLTVDGSPVLAGTVPDARLSPNVALLNANQSFTGSNSFSGNGASLTVSGTGSINTSLFTGLGFQFNNGSGEGAIMSSVNDTNSSLTFYTKSGPGAPTTKQMKIDRYGVLMIDQQNANYGALNDGTTNADGLVFGTGGGEGIASQRTAGVNKNGLDFYTGGNRQMSILNNGNVGMGITNPSTALQVSGTVTATGFAGNGNGLTNLNANNLANGTVPNSVLSGFQGNFSTVSGGNGNTAGNNEATVSGGLNNTASAQESTVSGGNNNQATAQFSTVPGGDSDLASGKWSFAGGRQAQATNQGAFVWADSQNAPFTSTNRDSFNVRAQGGVNFVTSGAGLTVDGQPVQAANNGSGLTNLNASALTSGTVPLAQLPGAVVTNNEPFVFLGTLLLNDLGLGGNLVLPLPTSVFGGGTILLHADNNANSYFGLVAGNADTGTSGSFNTGLGNAALSSNTTGSQNVAVGASALGNSQNDNELVAVGFQALQNDNAGNNGQTGDHNGHNTAIGYEALQADTFGAGNTATGYKAMGQDSNGSFNTAMGDNALNANTSGSDNVAIGTAALQNNTGDNELVAIGFDALQNDNAGNNGLTGDGNGHNTAIGYEALQEDSGGAGNTATGYLVLQQNISGSFNTAYGDGALNANTGGSHNVAIGDGALGNATGSGNIAIGSKAGGNRVSGDNNIYIGNTGTSAAESGIIRIGQPGTQTETHVAGQLFCTSITITGGSDLAEPFQIAGRQQDIPEGAVVVIDEANPGHLKMSDSPYDSHVAGVVSGANGIHPGIQMQQQGLLEGGRNVALTGRVYVQADASNGAIKPGDLLTTSRTPGRAMKVSDHLKAQGAILGKAMTGLKSGNGMVLVLVTLQ